MKSRSRQEARLRAAALRAPFQARDQGPASAPRHRAPGRGPTCRGRPGPAAASPPGGPEGTKPTRRRYLAPPPLRAGSRLAAAAANPEACALSRRTT